MNVRGTVYFMLGTDLNKLNIFEDTGSYSYNKKILFKSDYNYRMLPMAGVQIVPNEYYYNISKLKFFIFVPEDVDFDDLSLLKEHSFHKETVTDWRPVSITPTWVYTGLTKYGPSLTNASDGVKMLIYEIPEEAAYRVTQSLLPYSRYYNVSYKLSVGVRWGSFEQTYIWNHKVSYEENEKQIIEKYASPLMQYTHLVYAQLRTINSLIKDYKQLPNLKPLEEIYDTVD